MNAVHANLHQWDKDVLKGPKKRVGELKKELEKFRCGDLSPNSIARQKEILLLLENIMEQEEIFWLQRGRAEWLLHGDRNMEFIHNAAMEKKETKLYKEVAR